MHPADIKSELAKKDFTAAIIADELGVSRTAVSSVISGRSKSARIAKRIAEIIGKPIDEIWEIKTGLRRNRADFDPDALFAPEEPDHQSFFVESKENKDINQSATQEFIFNSPQDALALAQELLALVSLSMASEKQHSQIRITLSGKNITVDRLGECI